MNIPSNVKYSEDHEWLRIEGEVAYVGITDYAPMDFKDADGNWIGFDADMAKAFAKYLGVEVEFVEINWDTKTTELKTKTIDAVWNGMTITDKIKAETSVTIPYLKNKQVAVIRVEDQAKQYNIPFEMYLQYMGYTLESFEKQAKEVANKRIKADLVLSKIAEAEEIKVTPEELQAELKKLAEERMLIFLEVFAMLLFKSFIISALFCFIRSALSFVV